MRKYETLVGNDKRKKIDIKILLLSSMTEFNDMWELCSYKQLWDIDTLDTIVNKINNSHKRYNNDKLYNNVIKYLIPHGGLQVNEMLASLSVKYNTKCLLPYLEVRRRSIKNIILGKALTTRGSDIDDLYIIDQYIRANKLIPKFVLELLVSCITKKTKIGSMIEQSEYMGIKCSKWSVIVAEYCIGLLKNTDYKNSELDTLYLSVATATNLIKYNNTDFSIIDYWKRGGSLFLECTDVYKDPKNYEIYVELLKDSDRLDIAFIHSLPDALDDNISGILYTNLYIHQINNPSLYYKVPKEYRIPSIDTVRLISKCDGIKENPLYATETSFLESIKGKRLSYSDIELFFRLGGSYLNVSDVYDSTIAYDTIKENSRDFTNLEYYLWSSGDTEAIKNALRKTKALDFAETRPNVYGVGGTELTLSNLNIIQLSNIFSTKGLYMDTVRKNAVLLKYYKPAYLSSVDYTDIINNNAECVRYIDLSIYPISKILQMVEMGMVKLDHPHFMSSRDTLLKVLQSGIDLTLIPINLVCLYELDESLAEMYIALLLK